MNREEQDRSRWLRVGLFALTTVGPLVNTFLARMRRRVQLLQKQAGDAQETARGASATAFERLDEFTFAGRQRAAAQARQLEKQAQQLKSQARHLRAALRKEARQRRKLAKTVKQLREAGIDWSQELLKRGEDLSGELVLQGSRLSHDVVERGSQAMQGLIKQSSELSRDLAERGDKVTRNLKKRGEPLLQPVRRRSSTFWTIFGFSFGLVAATVVTYFFIRKRMARLETEQEQQIELPLDQELNVVSNSRPAGEILHIDSDGETIATLQAVEIDEAVVEIPADAAFVGVISKKYYYPLDTPLDLLPLADDRADDLVYFASEEEAKAQGFTKAE